MLCVIRRVWGRWAAVVDSKLICVSTTKDRAITLWKAGDARMSGASIDKFIWLTFLDRRFESIQAEELVGRGRTYQTAMRSGAELSEADKDEIARAIALVRSADWAQLPPKFQAYENANRAWSRARSAFMRAATEAVDARAIAEAAAAFAVKARREGNVLKTSAAKERAAELADKAKRLMQRAVVARKLEVRSTAAMRAATDAHLESNLWETRELVARDAHDSARICRAACRTARKRGCEAMAYAQAEYVRWSGQADALMLQLRNEDDASRGFRALGPVWRVFNM